jgi:hypothetical protein
VGNGDIIALAVFVVIMIVLLPIIIPLIIYRYFQQKVENHRFVEFLKQNEGMKFFCYTARRTSVEYVKENIIPFLPPHTRVVYLGDSKKIFTMGEDVPFLQRLVATMRMTNGGYPYVSKISSGKPETISINSRLYGAIRRNVDATSINQTIARFLESNMVNM